MKYKIGNHIIKSNTLADAVRIYKTHVVDTARKEVINKIRTTHIDEKETWGYGDKVEGWYVQIQNHGTVEGKLEINGKFFSKEKSGAWGRIWYDGRLEQMFEGPLNVVRDKMIKYLSSQMVDSVKDSDALKRLAYEFAQMGNYFDRANSAHSRQILGREDEQKYVQFKQLGMKVKQQLEKETATAKYSGESFAKAFDNETILLLNDAANRLSWTAIDKHDQTGKALADKIIALLNAYKKVLYYGKDSVDDSVEDADKHEIVTYTSDILREMGKNNSIGKYDRVISAMKSLFGEGFLTGEKLKEAIRREIPRILKKYNLEDAEDDDIEELSDEERQAIEDYKAAIANTKDPKLLQLFSHILNEEIEHLEELQNEKVEEPTEDSIDDDGEKWGFLTFYQPGSPTKQQYEKYGVKVGRFEPYDYGGYNKGIYVSIYGPVTKLKQIYKDYHLNRVKSELVTH